VVGLTVKTRINSTSGWSRSPRIRCAHGSLAHAATVLSSAFVLGSLRLLALDSVCDA
jgi:hypothetical protein